MNVHFIILEITYWQPFHLRLYELDRCPAKNFALYAAGGSLRSQWDARGKVLDTASKHNSRNCQLFRSFSPHTSVWCFGRLLSVVV